MPKAATSFRLSDLTWNQLDDLAAHWNMNKSEAISVIVNWAYHQELGPSEPIVPVKPIRAGKSSSTARQGG